MSGNLLSIVRDFFSSKRKQEFPVYQSWLLFAWKFQTFIWNFEIFEIEILHAIPNPE